LKPPLSISPAPIHPSPRLIIRRFASLDVRDQHRLAHAVGTDADLAIDSLRAIDAAAAALAACPE
jgi:hypothetical protein